MRDAIVEEEEHSVSDECRRHLRVEKEEEVSLSLLYPSLPLPVMKGGGGSQSTNTVSLCFPPVITLFRERGRGWSFTCCLCKC